MGVLLAGGKSTRMGRDKANVLVGQEKMLRVTRDTLVSSDVRSVSIVGASIDENDSSSAIFLQDIYPELGPLSGIHSAMTHVVARNKKAAEDSQVEGLLIVPVDMPGIEPSLLSRLATHGQKQSRISCFKLIDEVMYFPLYVPVAEEIMLRLEGLLKRATKVQEVNTESQQSTKDQSLSIKHFLNDYPVEFLETNMKEAFFNINTEQELSMFNAANR